MCEMHEWISGWISEVVCILPQAEFEEERARQRRVVAVWNAVALASALEGMGKLD